MTRQTFFAGALMLIAAGLITRILGFINKIVVARIMGSEGMGLYMMAVPSLLLIITLTQLGLPVAISKLIAEAEAHGEHERKKRILIVSLILTGSLSIVLTTAMIAFAPLLASFLLTDTRAIYPLMAIIPIVPIVALSAVMRGYFQGMQNMRPIAYSQVIEQVVRIALVAFCTTIFLPFGVEFAAAGAMISVVAGELVSLLYVFYVFKNKKTMRIRKNFFSALEGGKRTLKDLMAIALPTTGSRLVGSVSQFLEPIIVAQSLAIAGVATVTATSQYGELVGFVVPLLFLPAFITQGLSVSLVPAISEAHSKGDYGMIQRRLQQTTKIALLSGGISVVILYVFAVPLLTLMYEAPQAAVYLKVIAPFCIFLYFQMPLQSVLQALNLAKAAMFNSLIGAVVKMSAIAFLASRPELGIMGAALAICASIMLVTLLHFISVSRAVGFTLNVKDWSGTLLVTILTAGVATLAFRTFITAEQMLTGTLISLTITVVSYFVGLFVFRLLHIKNISRIPILQSFFR
ncbi:stage V sporulation protein B [Geomicrobium halophilum]|uniref:Stage V sporulation protein B n=1 Tax=Geomicrobium halophilum TaxID=549000 RepID=A0A841PKW7_9BACL|nr:stage V sporulation protein B [Geomicrobium halophilum]MBB6449507.1 stage V sporulation protein B [Geomicrobium halophilum]